ncbi:MAG: superoxide dismutase family protein [Candidatus Omnitrophica bacterium]|nr:superoxide dismutase family protein [Candidatus Omnitrophota bacterium]MBI2495091.1 superoxide dismutase family protein [Candidatus Omnitrophota bacterium]MBI3083612.1 superoxide dismutase family protein [Candidatus Omnitrophota bacterium]
MNNAWAVIVGVGLTLWSSGAFAETGTAVIQGTSEGSTVNGSAILIDSPDGLEVTVEVMGVAPGKHAIHIHQYGACDDKGNAAGGHFNPDGSPHGFLPSDGLSKAHPGDMGNLDVGQDGKGFLTIRLPDVALSGGRYSVGGRAIILHEKVDDFGQPTGNAGGRIGCGVIVIGE